MNKDEYAEYEEAVAAFFQREGIANLSSMYDHNTCYEPYFSWQGCECCDRSEGSMVEDCNGYNETTKKVQGPYRICADCVYYAEYGQLDDTTMESIERSEE